MVKPMNSSERASTVPGQSAEPNVIRALHHLMSLYNAVHTNDRRDTAAGHWINEAFVLRLYAVLEAHGVVGNNKRIDYSLPHADTIDLCRRLRHEIGHSTGDVGDVDTRKLDKRLRQHFNLGDVDSLFHGKFLLPKDRVLRPMFVQSLNYCEALLAGGSRPAE